MEAQFESTGGSSALTGFPRLPDGGLLSPQRAHLLVWGFVALGVAVRLLRYALRFPLWCDEYQLAANFLDRDFLTIMQPLQHGQVAPLGFLWLELASIRLFGFNEWTLRLLPCVCAVGSVFLFAHVARRLLTGLPLVLAVAVFSVSYYPIRLGAEVKPYACDLMASLVVVACGVEWLRDTSRARWMWLLAALAPACMLLSFPVVFVLGGVSLALLMTVWRSRQPAIWTAYAVFNLGVAITFLTLLQINVGSQYQASQKFMVDYWASGFPPLTQPLQCLLWFVRENTSEMFSHPLGAAHGGSIVSTICCISAGVWFWRHGHRRVVLMLLGTIGLALIAAALRRYPYGTHARLCQHLSPLICLFVGAGAGVLIARLRQPAGQRLALRGAVLTLALIGSGMMVRDIVKPYKSNLDYQHQNFARAVWSESDDVETISIELHEGQPLYTGSFVTAFQCYREIYHDSQFAEDEDTNHATIDANDSAAVLAAQFGDDPPAALRCVVVHSLSAERNEAALQDWLADMQKAFDLTRTEAHRLPLICRPPEPHAEFYEQCYDVYWFTPKPLRSLQMAGLEPRSRQ